MPARAEPTLLGLTLPTRDQVQLARQIQAYLDRYTPGELRIHPTRPGQPARTDRSGLWNDLRQQDTPCRPATPLLHGRLTVAVLVATGGAARLKTCATSDCQNVFADSTNSLNRARCAHHLRSRP